MARPLREVGRWTGPARSAVVVLGLLFAVPGRVVAQGAVTTVSGNHVALSVGAQQGVAVGMTGRITRTEMIGGESQTYDVAYFRVLSLGETTSKAELTQVGSGQTVDAGLAAVFKQPLIGPAADPAVTAQPPREESPERPVAAEFALQEVGGGTIRLSDYRGKVVLLDFWATFDHDVCRAHIPHLNALYAENKNRGLDVLGISVDQAWGSVRGADFVRAVAKDMAINYPLAVADVDVVREYGINSVPTTFLIDRSRRVQQTYLGVQPKGVYEKDIGTILAESVPKQGAHSANGHVVT